MKPTVGTKIDVGDVIGKATSLLRANPSIILIQAIPAVPLLIGDVARSGVFNPLAFLTTLIGAILAVIMTGAYAPVVKEAAAGQKLTIGQAIGMAADKFLSLLGAGILIVIIVALGTIIFVVPGIIFATWYAYTAPAIMLEDKGALEGMSASKAFGRDKKWSTFTIFLVFFLAYVVILLVGGVLSIGGGGRVIGTLLEIPLGAWTSVVINYVYVTHGPTAAQQAQPGMAPPGPQPGLQPPPTAMGTTPPPAPGTAASGALFCSHCGAPLKAGARFCASCGSPV